MRRSVYLLVLGAALASALPASASFQPIRRSFGETTLPRVRAGVIRAPAGHAAGRVRVIVDLPLPPLAAWSARRSLAATGTIRRLDARTAASRHYLARLASAQRRAAATLRRAIPEARISWHYHVVLDGFAVSLPVRRLPALVRLGFVRRIYPSTTYTLALNRSPSVIGADVLHAETGAFGDGVKIAVVDTGIDQTNPFLRSTGFSYPAGFPKGDTRYTTPKVIVAKSFPGPGSGAQGRIPADLAGHGTHVSGIAAGAADTPVPPGADHPSLCCLSGVAPRAWLGNYRVFTIPTPIGPNANTPEIAKAFDAAVADGMDVINFSGGGAETEPASDAMTEAVRNTVNAGVVPVISAGNDRDDFGLGSVGSPATIPDAIAVAAVSNQHVFSPALSVTAPGAPDYVHGIPLQPGPNDVPFRFETQDHDLVDVGTLFGTNGAPVDRYLCGPADDPNNPDKSPLGTGVLAGDVALVSRGICTFTSKAVRAFRAGATGIVYVDNRPGEANPVPVAFGTDGLFGMVSDLDGARLRDYLDSVGGRAPIRVSTDDGERVTGRSGIVTSFSSAGPTDFRHDLKPDVAAPGGQVLSSVPPQFGGSPFAVFDGTSMSAPHVSGSAALLVQLHPSWTPQQIKSALMSTAGAAWGNTQRTQEASVLLEGAGLVNLPRATDPKIFTDPPSLSFERLASGSKTLLVHVTDAGDGAGTWEVGLAPQQAPNAAIDVTPALVVPPGGSADLAVTARVTGAGSGDNYGFVVLRRGDVTRRIPYDVFVDQPALASARPRTLKRLQRGQTAAGESRANQYCCPSAPFGPAPAYFGTPMNENGSETVYVTRVRKKIVNMGVAVLQQTRGAQVDPWFLGSLDENDVQGYAGTPVNVNELMFDFRFDVGAAGLEYPDPGTYYVSVDSGTDIFTGRRLAGAYRLRSWVNDVKPPKVKLLTTRVAAGRPTIVARVTDAGSGVDPFSLVIGYRNALVGAAAYDPTVGLALFPLPAAAPTLPAGRRPALVYASDYQETKNVAVMGKNIQPNTRFAHVKLRVLRRPTLTWLRPAARRCAARKEPLLVVASSTAAVRSVRFTDGTRRIGVDRAGVAGLFGVDWSTRKAHRGEHLLRAVARDARGRTVAATRAVRVCR